MGCLKSDERRACRVRFGDASLVNTQIDKYRAVTVDAVNAFARAALGADNRASLVYVPRASQTSEAA